MTKNTSFGMSVTLPRGGGNFCTESGIYVPLRIQSYP